MADFDIPVKDAESECGATFGPVKKGQKNCAKFNKESDPDEDEDIRAADPANPAEPPPPPATSATWVFKPRTPEDIQNNREAIPASIYQKLKQPDWIPKGPEKWVYVPTAADLVPTQLTTLKDSVDKLPAGSEKEKKLREYQIKDAVWREMRLEGGCSSVATYDGPKVTWGRGFALNTGGLALMRHIFKNCPAVVEKFHSYGIHFESRKEGYKDVSRLIVANSPTEATVTGTNSEANLYIMNYKGSQGEKHKSLIAAFILIAEDSTLQQQVVDAQYATLTAPQMAGDVPEYVKNWPDDVIRFVAHTSHWMPIWGWHSKLKLWNEDTDSIDKVLDKWSRTAGKLQKNGAYVFEDTNVLAHFRGAPTKYENGWGSSVAWKELQHHGSKEAMAISKAELTDPLNTQYAGMFFYAAGNGYFCYPEFTLYYYQLVQRLHYPEDRTMAELLKVVEKLSYSQICDTYSNYSGKIVEDFKLRVKVALSAVKYVKLKKKQPTPKPDKNVVVNEPGMFQLSQADKDEVIKYIGGNASDYPDEAIARLREYNYDECVKILNSRSMDGILTTLDKLDIFQITTLQENYSSTILSKYGGRVWAAVEAARIKKANAPAVQQTTDKNNLLANTRFTELPADQESSIKKYLGISTAPVDDAIVKLNAEDYDGCSNLLGARSMQGILDTLRPVAREKLVYYSNAFYEQDLFSKYGGRTFLAIEAIKWKNKLVEERQIFKSEYDEYYSSLPFDQKELICAELKISAL